MGVNPADLAGLTVEEKLALISELWDSIESTAAIPPLSDEQSRELARRRAEGLADPAATIDWPSVRQELFKKSVDPS
ncbi:MAG TPA: addiction module protein [Reyranella sp.]